jgi:twinkle protein
MPGGSSMSKLEKIAEKLNAVNLPDVDFEAYLKAHEDDSQKVKRVSDYYDELTDYIENGDQMQGSTMPFPKMKNLFGFRGGEVTLWTGFNGHKKSMLLGFVAINFLKQGDKVCTASFEMKPVSTIKRMTRQYTGTQEPDYDQYADFMGFAGNNFYIFDHLGGISPERIYGVIMYCATEMGVKHFIIDSLMRVVAGEDKYNEQKDFVVKLCEVAQRTNTHIHLVHHVRDGDESKPSTRYSAKGSKAISDNVHNSLIVWSNKNKIEDMPDVILKCDKQREGEWEGMIALDFDPQSLTFTEAFKGE